MKLYLSGDKNKDMGDDYNHSTFIDLVLSGLFGLRGRADGVVEIDPFDSDRRLYHALRRGPHYVRRSDVLSLASYTRYTPFTHLVHLHCRVGTYVHQYITH